MRYSSESPAAAHHHAPTDRGLALLALRPLSGAYGITSEKRACAGARQHSATTRETREAPSIPKGRREKDDGLSDALRPVSARQALLHPAEGEPVIFRSNGPRFPSSTTGTAGRLQPRD